VANNSSRTDGSHNPGTGNQSSSCRAFLSLMRATTRVCRMDHRSLARREVLATGGVLLRLSRPSRPKDLLGLWKGNPVGRYAPL